MLKERSVPASLFLEWLATTRTPLGYDGPILTNRHNTKRALRVSVPCI
jgi:hypothetical protein